MAKYRKKPVVIEAEQFQPGITPWPVGVEERFLKGDFHSYVIETLEGFHRVIPGDWIITGVKGERYPCKPDIFEMTYDPVLSQPAPSWAELHGEEVDNLYGPDQTGEEVE